MDNFLAELAKNRGILLEKMMEISWSYTGRDSKVQEINKQLEAIDKLIDRVLEPAPGYDLTIPPIVKGEDR